MAIIMVKIIIITIEIVIIVVMKLIIRESTLVLIPTLTIIINKKSQHNNGENKQKTVKKSFNSWGQHDQPYEELKNSKNFSTSNTHLKNFPGAKVRRMKD